MAKGKQKDYPAPFGRYYLTQKIAMGGMAEIFRAKSIGAEGFEKTVVIKRILPHFSEDESFVTMFQDEARVAAHLNHANVVQIFDFDEVDGLYYIAMEYVEGQDLKRALDIGAKLGNPMNIAQSVYCMIEAGQGLDYAHKREVDGKPLNIIHRDISPHNIMVSYNGEVKIMDFGIAKAASRSTKTRVGTVKGKCAYMSPEQARGKQLDGRSDLFALGVCLWEMLSGKRLFVGESDFETLNNVLRAEVPSLCDMNPDVPIELDAIIQKALDRDVDARQRDVSEWVGDLRRWFYSAVPDPSAVTLKTYMHSLFNEQIGKLKQDVQREAEALSDMRTNSGLRRPITKSNEIPALLTDDESTVAIDTSDGLLTSDSEATMALPDAAAMLAQHRSGTASGAQVPAKKSKTGLFVGIGALAVAVIGAGVFFGTSKQSASRPPPVVPAVAATEAPKQEQITIQINAPGAKEIQINGETEATADTYEYSGEQGKRIKILAIGAPGQKKLVWHTLEKNGAVVDIELPTVTKKAAPSVAAIVAVVIQVDPSGATVTVNGKPAAVNNGNVKIAGQKLGDTLVVEATAPKHKPFKRNFIVKKQPIELFDVKLTKIAGPKAASPGKVLVRAVPWAKIIYKGRKMGLTPTTIRLPAGRQTITLVQGGKTKTVTVNVASGRTIKARTVNMRN
jgi:serine/threonine protein kinase